MYDSTVSLKMNDVQINIKDNIEQDIYSYEN